jgi:hypothetical protein
MANRFAILLLLNGSRQWAGALQEADQQCDVDDRGLHVQAEAVFSLLQSNFEVFKLSEAEELHRGIQKAYPMSLAQTSMGTGKKASALAQSGAQKPLPLGWFGDFSEAESTYDKDGLDSHNDNPEWAVKYGRDPSLPPSSSHAEKFPSHFFHESQSGGPQAAWQTNWPSVKSSVPGMRGTEENSWREEPMGWVQEYRPMSKAVTKGNVGPENANWFDNSMRNVDGFGRKMQPGIDDGQKHFDWVARSVDTTLTCKEVGCLAQSSLQLFDPTTEEATESVSLFAFIPLTMTMTGVERMLNLSRSMVMLHRGNAIQRPEDAIAQLRSLFTLVSMISMLTELSVVMAPCLLRVRILTWLMNVLSMVSTCSVALPLPHAWCATSRKLQLQRESTPRSHSSLQNITQVC